MRYRSERRPYQEHPERFEYLLTAKGKDLLVVVGALGMWGQRWTEGPDTTSITHERCGHRVALKAYCEECDRPVETSEIRVPRMIRPLVTAAG